MPHVLTLNGGSSSIRFAFYSANDASAPVLAGKMDRIGLAGTGLTVDDMRRGPGSRTRIEVNPGHRSAVCWLMDWLAAHPLMPEVGAAGHRVVHGMQHSNAERVTAGLLAELKRIVPYDPEHLPREIELVESLQQRCPDLPQVACFDTAFHRSMPRVATMLPLPRRYESRGVQRYGFHGLSYAYLMGKLVRIGDPAAVSGRVVLAHLGNGASLAAVRDGKSIDTSMGFTPASGVVMSTRSGDLDPGVISFLAATEGMDISAYQRMVALEAGLLGVSETSSDIRDLLARESADVRAAEALALFCYQIKKWIGAFAAALGGIDTLVFAGGIGENAAVIRSRICANLGFLGIELDETRNATNAPLVSTDSGPVAVRVIPTDEESVIAALTMRALGWNTKEA
jgi:acetate kinase